MATHSNILSKKIPRDREAWGVYGPWGHKRVDWTEQLNNDNKVAAFALQ